VNVIKVSVDIRFVAAVDQALDQSLQIAGEHGLRTHYRNGGYYG
jgi:hypothetical protein